jgi:hypothetical protein
MEDFSTRKCVCPKVAREVACATEDGGTHSVECPVKVMFTVMVTEKSGQEKNQCLLCVVLVLLVKVSNHKTLKNGCVFYCHLKTYCGPSSETMQSPE